MSEDDQPDRHETILTAAIDLLRIDGLGSLTHRRIARAAGVPLASTTYHFASLDDLTAQAVDRLVDQELEGLTTRLAAADPNDLVSVVQAAVEVLGGGDDDSRERATALVGVYAEALHRPELAETLRRWNAGCCAAITETLSRDSWPEPGSLARVVLALADGLVFEGLAEPPETAAVAAGEIARTVADRFAPPAPPEG